MNKTQATEAIRFFATTEIEKQDRDKFIEVVEREFFYLHEGNIARFKIGPKEYEEWRKGWQ